MIIRLNVVAHASNGDGRFMVVSPPLSRTIESKSQHLTTVADPLLRLATSGFNRFICYQTGRIGRFAAV